MNFKLNDSYETTVVSTCWQRALCFAGENTYNGDQSDAHQSTFSHSSKEGYVSIAVFTRKCDIP